MANKKKTNPSANEADEAMSDVKHVSFELKSKLKPMVPPSKCNCSKSKCLKLYCECFARGIHCSEECLCTNCCNLAGKEDLIEAAKADILKRDPLAFVKKLDASSDNLRHRKGCNCKRSGCSKGYCECH